MYAVRLYTASVSTEQHVYNAICFAGKSVHCVVFFPINHTCIYSDSGNFVLQNTTEEKSTKLVFAPFLGRNGEEIKKSDGKAQKTTTFRQ